MRYHSMKLLPSSLNFHHIFSGTVLLASTHHKKGVDKGGTGTESGSNEKLNLTLMDLKWDIP